MNMNIETKVETKITGVTLDLTNDEVLQLLSLFGSVGGYGSVRTITNGIYDILFYKFVGDGKPFSKQEYIDAVASNKELSLYFTKSK